MEYDELRVAKSYSLKRRLIAAICARAAHLKISMSAYVAAVIEHDLTRGIDAPFAPGPTKIPGPTKVQAQIEQSQPRGVVVEFDF